jgi:methionine-rich copper-binding protein CopC
VLQGKRLFYDARDPRLARDGYMSCASCHNDGGHDGRVWDLTGFGEGLRNTIALRGRGSGHGRAHWTGNFDEIQDFELQIRNLAGGTGLMSDAALAVGTRSQPLGDPKAGLSSDLDALAAYVNSLTSFAPSPWRPSPASLSAAASAGRDAFVRLDCASCHTGQSFTNSSGNALPNVGTIKPSSGSRLGAPLTGLDVPTLRDVWATAPYLHDGSAPTLEAAISAHTTSSIASVDATAIAAYLREIGSDEGAAPAAGVTVSIWPASAVPGVVTSADSGAVTLGTKFRSDVAGTIAAIRFYKGPQNTGTHIGGLWTSTGQLLASVTFSGETASGWQQAALSSPVPISAHTVYVVGYHAPNGMYPSDYYYFAANGVDNAPLHALRDGESGANGIYVYGPSLAFPAQTFRSSSYWVDVVFNSGSVADTTPPTVATTTPSNGATGVSTGASVSAVFSETIDAATLTSSTFTLRNTSSGAAVTSSIGWDAATRTATLTPGAPLAAGTSWTAAIVGGGSDPRVKDAAGNALAATVQWAFTTATAGDTTPPTITATSPSSGATGVSATANITVTFSEAMNASTISTSTIELRDAGGNVVPSVVTYSASNRRATLNPNPTLAAAALYTVTVKGGTTDPRVKDVAGNALAVNRVWSFRTR